MFFFNFALAFHFFNLKKKIKFARTRKFSGEQKKVYASFDLIYSCTLVI